MRKLIWKRPVFYTLLSIGLLFFLLLIPGVKERIITSLFQVVIQCLIGMVTGILIVFFEIDKFQKRQTIDYHPTKAPHIVYHILLALILISGLFHIFLAIICGSYLITLAISFHIYEIRTGRKNIRWFEILER